MENNHVGARVCSYPAAYPKGFISGKSRMECASICQKLGSGCGGFNWRHSDNCRSNLPCCQLCKENDSRIQAGITAYLKDSFP